jgi:RHS repeat-associated protein
LQLNEYDPWGKVSRSEGSADPSRGFNGKELDPESGLYYYGGRYYDPDLARFVSPDPFVTLPTNPQSLNRYSYTINNPVMYIDPSGYSWFSSLFKSIGNFFKNIFKNPGQFFATLAVGVATGWFAGPLGAAMFGAQTWGAAALAGALGGAATGAVGAAMNGSNIWQGALLGAVGGGVGGGVAGHIGLGTTEGIIGGAVAGGGAAGAVGSAFRRGNFFDNMFGGAFSNGLFASLQVAAMKGWEIAEKFTDESAKAGTGRLETGKDGRLRTDGARICDGSCDSLLPSMEKEGGRHWYDNDNPFARAFGRFANLTSKVHDWMNSWNYSNGNFVGRGIVFNTAFDALWSYPGMIPAAAYTAFAFGGNAYSYSVPLR